MFTFWRSDGQQKEEKQTLDGTEAVEPLKSGEGVAVSETKQDASVPTSTGSPETTSAAPTSPLADSSTVEFPRPSTSTEVYVSQVQTVPKTVDVDITGAVLLSPNEPDLPTRRRRISFRSFSYFYGRSRPAPATDDANEGEVKDTPVPKAKIKSKREARKVDKAALVLRSFLLGHNPVGLPSPLPNGSSTKETAKGKSAAQPPVVKPPNPAKLQKANNQLLSPDQANRVIAKLRTLPIPDGPELPGIEYAGEHVRSRAEGPIHAVCLDCTEEEAEEYHFSRLVAGDLDEAPPLADEPEGVTVYGDPGNKKKEEPASIASANLASLIPVLQNIHVVTLVSSPDLGFGQGPQDPGPLAGSVPSPEVVSTGMMEITGQLLALGFATSNAVYPDHSGVYPPKDRLSVLTYWWGMEVCLPPPTLKYLANVKSIQNSALNLLTAMSLFNNGVREILPFIRYISQYLDFQWGAIQGQDKGNGVVCAATWVCPAALVPRPWDFPNPPAGQAVVLPKSQPPSGGPTLVFPGSKGGGMFTPDKVALPHVMITPATLPRGAKFEMLKT